MERVTRRDMRNNSGALLRRIAAGESVVVTDNGQPVAVMAPVGSDPLARLEATGQLRRARRPISALSTIRRTRPAMRSDELVVDARGRW